MKTLAGLPIHQLQEMLRRAARRSPSGDYLTLANELMRMQGEPILQTPSMGTVEPH